MGINGLVNETLLQTIPKAASSLTPQPSAERAKESGISESVVYEPSGAGEKKYSADIGRMREIWTEHDRQVASFQRLVQTLLNRQADEALKAGEVWNFDDPTAMVDIDEETRTAAQKAIGEGGYFSTESTAARLLDFAVAISGGDPKRIEVLRTAVERGFEAAESQWGGKLPDISSNTYDAVKNGFDEWAKNGLASDITLLKKEK